MVRFLKSRGKNLFTSKFSEDSWAPAKNYFFSGLIPTHSRVHMGTRVLLPTPGAEEHSKILINIILYFTDCTLFDMYKNSCSYFPKLAVNRRKL